MLSYVILGFLCDRDMTGYEIKQMMINSTSNFMDASFGSIYPNLKKMEKDGLISFHEVIDGGHYRKSYSITKEGRELFLKWLSKPCQFSPFDYEHLGKLFFYKNIEKEKRKELINILIQDVNKELQKLVKLEEELGQYMDYYEHATLLYGKEKYEMTIKWYEELNNKKDI